MGRFQDNANDDSVEDSIDISPLIDVVFILLIFFIVTTTIIQESGLQVDRPQPASSEPQDSESLVFTVTENGEVMFEGQSIGISGVQPLVRNRLREQDVPVVIQTEKQATTELMVRVVDEAKLAGAEKISLANL